MENMTIENYFKKWVSTKPELNIHFHEAGIEAMAFAKDYNSEKNKEIVKQIEDLKDLNDANLMYASMNPDINKDVLELLEIYKTKLQSLLNIINQ
jgi:phenolic acid decarboxylase